MAALQLAGVGPGSIATANDGIRPTQGAGVTLDSYVTLRDEKLATLPGVQRLTSTIVMKRIVTDWPLPLSTAERGRKQPGTRPQRKR